jgi:hypothetical protein
MTWAGILLALVGHVVFSFVDPSITESSGLVDLGQSMVTANDSGNAAVLYTVDSRTGRTVGRTTYADHTEDVEALAPGRGPSAGSIWAGDIGDNEEQRSSVRAYRVVPGAGSRRVHAPSYELVYPDGAHDAESLVVDPGGRLFVITKGLLGGTAYVAPRVLSTAHPNRLTAVARVGIWATDAALFPDGKHVLVRGYGTAAIYTFPGFGPVATLDLPHQRQGEGISIGDSGRIRLSSEGRNSPVLEVALPDRVVAAMAGATPSATAPAPATPAAERHAVHPTDRAAHAWLLVVAVGAGAAGLVILLLLVRPRRRVRRSL